VENIEEVKKELMNRPEIEYPCAWSYRVIGTDEKTLRHAISECLEGREYRVSLSSSSSSGKYISLNLETIVHSEEIRVSTYHSLGRHPSVKIVL
jgi:putative lipoic acid-binding regulatory protein